MATSRPRLAQTEGRPQIRLLVAPTEARGALDDRIQKGKELLSSINSIGSKEAYSAHSDAYFNWSSYNRTLLERLFSGPILAEYESSAAIFVVGPSTLVQDMSERTYDLNRDIRRLDSIVERLDLWPGPSAAAAAQPAAVNATTEQATGTRVFVVHGRDEGAKHQVARFLESVRVDALILAEQASRGKTLVEKLEFYSAQVGFAVVILSPDDVGALAGEPDKLRGRPRQNVVFEMGYFVGLIGRARVCALLVDDLQSPTDVDGVVYIQMGGNWKMDLAAELRAAGYPIDMNNAVGGSAP